jgi:hypothetical protein
MDFLFFQLMIALLQYRMTMKTSNIRKKIYQNKFLIVLNTWCEMIYSINMKSLKRKLNNPSHFSSIFRKVTSIRSFLSCLNVSCQYSLAIADSRRILSLTIEILNNHSIEKVRITFELLLNTIIACFNIIQSHFIINYRKYKLDEIQSRLHTGSITISTAYHTYNQKSNDNEYIVNNVEWWW